MRRRPTARLLLLDEEEHLLLYRFAKKGALAGQNFWATVGGGVETGETFAEAARRELLEETGIGVETVGESVAVSEFFLEMSTGEKVMVEERFFVVRVMRSALSNERWTVLEKEEILEHRWWSVQELQATNDVFYPENLLELLGHRSPTE